MNLHEIKTLWAYNWWANLRILNTTTAVSAQDFIAPALSSFGSLRGTLVHILGTELVWRRRCQEGKSSTSLLQQAEFATFDALFAYWQKEEGLTQVFIDSLRENDLTALVKYTNTKGVPYENPLWEILCHVVNHGTQFRSEAGMLLTGLKHSPGDIDLIFYLRERGQP